MAAKQKLQFTAATGTVRHGFVQGKTRTGTPMVSGHFALKSGDTEIGKISIGAFENGGTVKHTVAIELNTTGFAHEQIHESIMKAMGELGNITSDDLAEGENGIAIRNLGSTRSNNRNYQNQNGYNQNQFQNPNAYNPNNNWGGGNNGGGQPF